MAVLNIDSKMWNTDGTILKLAVLRAMKYLNSPGYPLIIARLVKNVLRETSHGTVDGEDYHKDILDFSVRTLKESDLTVVVGDAESFAFGQCIGDAAIYLNGGWIAQAQRILEKCGVEHEQLRVHLSMIILKILHEHSHSMTAKIMKYEHRIRARAALTNPMVPTGIFDRTPLKIGYKNTLKGQPQLGDMGFAVEELLSGTGVRFNSDDANTRVSGVQWDFQKLKLWQQSDVDNRLFILRRAKSDVFQELICFSSEPSMSDFHVELQEMTDNKRKSKPHAETSVKKSKLSDSNFHVHSPEDENNYGDANNEPDGTSAAEDSLYYGGSSSDSEGSFNLCKQHDGEFSPELGFVCPVSRFSRKD